MGSVRKTIQTSIEDKKQFPTPRMKFSALFIFSLALLSFATLAEAGCNENGCCYCGQDGAVIWATQGQYRYNCQPGFYCRCGRNSSQGLSSAPAPTTLRPAMKISHSLLQRMES